MLDEEDGLVRKKARLEKPDYLAGRRGLRVRDEIRRFVEALPEALITK